MSDMIAAVPPAQPAAQEPHAGSLPRRVMDTFFSPVALFSRFGTRPPWWDVMLVSVILGAIGFALIPLDVWVNTMEEAMRQRGQEIPAGMEPEAMAGVQRIFGLVFGGIIFPWILLAAVSGVMVLLFSVILGGSATFRQYIGVVAHASLIGAVGQLVSLPIIIKTGAMAGITLGAVAGGMDHDSFIYQFLNAWNVFLVWQVVVISLGASALNRRISVGTAVGVGLGIYAAVALLIAAI